MNNGSNELPALHDAAREFARIGGLVSLEWFGDRELSVDRKADESPVTIADRTTEQVIRDAIQRRFPEHRVVGEEQGGTIAGSGYEWIIDPIDGTKTFIRGVPLFTTLIAVLYQGDPIVGVIHAPATGEMVSAARDLGAWDHRGRPVRVSSASSIEEAWYGTTDPADFYRREPEFSTSLLQRCEAARTWADAYGYMLVARGDLDVMIDPILAPWDVAPLGVVIREAGGVFSDFSGASPSLCESAVACASQELHREILQLYRNTTRLTPGDTRS